MALGLRFMLGAVNYSAFGQIGSLRTNDNLWARNTMGLTLRDDLLSYRPVVGQPITLYDTDDTTKLFYGSIDEVDETYYPGISPYRDYRLVIVDPNQVCDRHLVVDSFIDPLQTLGDIARYIVANYLAEDGVSDAGVQDGPIIPETKLFNYRTVTQVFNELSTLSNYLWYIDYNNVLQFKPKSATLGPVSLSYANCISVSTVRSRGIGPYRNRQYVRAGTALTDQRTENLHGDSFRRTHNTTYAIERTPVITLNSVGQSVGIHGLDTGKQFYWTRGNNQVVQDDAGTPLISTDVLAVTYIGRFPIAVQASLADEILERKSIEGGSGVYESLYLDKNLNDLLASQNLALALLARNGYIPDNVKVVTDQVGLRSGQLVHCDFPGNDVLGDYLVHSVEGSDQGGMFMRYQVNLLNFLSL